MAFWKITDFDILELYNLELYRTIFLHRLLIDIGAKPPLGGKKLLFLQEITVFSRITASRPIFFVAITSSRTIFFAAITFSRTIFQNCFFWKIVLLDINECRSQKFIFHRSPNHWKYGFQHPELTNKEFKGVGKGRERIKNWRRKRNKFGKKFWRNSNWRNKLKFRVVRSFFDLKISLSTSKILGYFFKFAQKLVQKLPQTIPR